MGFLTTGELIITQHSEQWVHQLPILHNLPWPVCLALLEMAVLLMASLCLKSLVTHLLSHLLSSSFIYYADPTPFLSEVSLFIHSLNLLLFACLFTNSYYTWCNKIFRKAPTHQKENRCSSVLGDYRHLHSSNHSTRTLVTDENEGRARKDTLRCACCTQKQSCQLESLLPVISLLPPLVCLKRSPSTRTLGQRTSEKKKARGNRQMRKHAYYIPVVCESSKPYSTYSKEENAEGAGGPIFFNASSMYLYGC